MANIALQGGKVILKDGKASCTCCEESMIIYYNYTTHPDLWVGIDACPDVGTPCGPSETPSCSNAVLNGFIYSDPWPSIPLGKTPKAKIYAGAALDNWGNIGSAYSDNVGTNECVYGYTASDVIDTATLDGNKMKLPFSAINAQHGGPYGIFSAVIEWYWE